MNNKDVQCSPKSKKRKASDSPEATRTETTNVPPMFLHDINDWKTHQKSVRDITINFTAQISGRQIKINAKSPDDYRDISRFLQSNNIAFHTYALKKEKVQLKVVIRGLYHDANPDDIKEELTELGFNVTSVHQLKRNSYLMPLYLCVIEGDNQSEIYKVTGLQSLKINIEGYRSQGRDVRQCFKCQRYGHSSVHCYAKPRCVKCPGDHDTKECKKKDGEPPFCVNCNTHGHPANYRGCQTHQKIINSKWRPLSAPITPGGDIQNKPTYPNRTAQQKSSHTPQTPREGPGSYNRTEDHNYNHRRWDRLNTPKPKATYAKNPFTYPQPHKSQPESEKIYQYSQALKSSNTPGAVTQTSQQVYGAFQEQINFISDFISNLITKLNSIVTMLRTNA